MVLFNGYYYYTTVTYLVRDNRVSRFQGYNNIDNLTLYTAPYIERNDIMHSVAEWLARLDY